MQAADDRTIERGTERRAVLTTMSPLR